MSHHYKKNVSSTSSGSGLGFVANLFRSTSKHQAPVPVEPSSRGGAPNQDAILSKLGPENSIPDRITAAEKALKSIEEYEVSSIENIWYLSKDMSDSKKSPECREAALKLTIGCIKRQSDLRGTAIAYYSYIVEASNVQDMELILEATEALTKNGTDAEAFFKVKVTSAQVTFPQILLTWFNKLFKELTLIRSPDNNGGHSQHLQTHSNSEKRDVKTKKDVASIRKSSTQENFYRLLNFMGIIYKHNYMLYSVKDVFNLINSIIGACLETSFVNDIVHLLGLLKVIQSTDSVPLELLPLILGVLSFIMYQKDSPRTSTSDTSDETLKPSIHDLWESCRTESWLIIRNFLDTDFRYNTFKYLCDIVEMKANLQRYSDKKKLFFTPSVISLQKLFRVVSDPESKYPSIFSLRQILKSYLNAIDSNPDNYPLGEAITESIFELLNDENTRSLFTYDIWKSDKYSPLEILDQMQSESHTRLAQYAPHNLSLNKYLPRRDDKVDRKERERMKAADQIIKKLQDIFLLLADLIESDSISYYKQTIIEFFVDMSPYLDERTALLTIERLQSNYRLYPFSENWQINISRLVDKFFKDSSYGSSVREKMVNFVYTVYLLAKETCSFEEQKSLLDCIYLDFYKENDSSVLKCLLDHFVLISQDIDLDLFNHLVEILFFTFSSSKLEEVRHPSLTPKSSIIDFKNQNSPYLIDINNTSLSLSSASNTPFSNPIVPTSSRTSTKTTSLEFNVLAQQQTSAAFCKAFVQNFQHSASKCSLIYSYIIKICQGSKNNPVIFIEVARLLCRIRATSEGFVYLENPSNMEGISTVLDRNTSDSDNSDADTSGRLWSYPETLSYLSKEQLHKPSPMLKIHSNEFGMKNKEYEINISDWYNEILSIIEHGSNWEVYSFVWAHLGPQLSNMELFGNSGCDIQRLRMTVCDQILKEKPPLVKYPKNITKSDVLLLLVRIISSLLAYHDRFSKADEDAIVRALVHGLSSHDKMAVSCIHCLLVCCYELPVSLKKFLGPIFTKLQTRITNNSIAPHVMEFLMSICRLPTLADNFTQEEYKRVFGIAFKYINSARPLAFSNANARAATTAISSIPSQNETQQNISHYLLEMAFNVIATWFLTLKVEDRKFLAKYITRNLILSDGTQTEINTQGLAYIDLIARFTYSDLDLTIQTSISSPSKLDSKNRSMKQWIYGASIVTVDIDKQTGETYLIIRRPTGTVMFTLRPDDSLIPTWLEKTVLKRYNSNMSFFDPNSLRRGEFPTAFSAEYMMLQFMYPTDPETSVKPLPIPSTPATDRAISSFDRIPVVEFHKVGIIYIGPGQTDENEILANQAGSLAYETFLQNIGDLVRLKNNKRIYTGGLDTSNDMDGQYTYIWSDKTTQMVCHITTMMPPPSNPHDTSFSSKKRHIGNDFIKIFFDESNLPFDFNLIKTEFNIINIVVTPLSVNFSKSRPFTSDSTNNSGLSHSQGNSKMDTPQLSGQQRLVGGDDFGIVTRQFYKVRVHCDPSIPDIFSACHLKIISEDYVADYVRNLALTASKFATIWKGSKQYKSNWQHRLIEINTIKERILTDGYASKTNNTNTTTNNNNNNANNSNNSNSSLGHRRTESIEKKGELDDGSSFLNQLSEVASIDDPEKNIRGGSGGSGNSENDTRTSSTLFVMEDQEEPEFPLLRSLEFTSFTQ